MTTTFQSPKRFRRIFAAFGAGAMALLAAFAIIYHDPLFSLLASVPAALTLSVPDAYATLPKNVLASRLADREQELARIRYQSVLYSVIVEENKRLEKLLGLPDQKQVAVGRVIGRPPQTHYDTFLVKLNEGHTVRVGDFASFEGVLLGVVERVGSGTAQVALYSTGGTEIDARVGEPSGIVVLQGLGGGAFMVEIPQSVTVREGDVLTASHDDTYALAIVESVISDPNTTLKTVYAHLPSSFSDIRYVTFLRSNPEAL